MKCFAVEYPDRFIYVNYSEVMDEMLGEEEFYYLQNDMEYIAPPLTESENDALDYLYDNIIFFGGTDIRPIDVRLLEDCPDGYNVMSLSDALNSV